MTKYIEHNMNYNMKVALTKTGMDMFRGYWGRDADLFIVQKPFKFEGMKEEFTLVKIQMYELSTIFGNVRRLDTLMSMYCFIEVVE